MIKIEDILRLRYLIENNKVSYYTSELLDSLVFTEVESSTPKGQLPNIFVYMGKCSLYSVLYSILQEGLSLDEVDNLSDDYIKSYIVNDLKSMNEDITYAVKLNIANGLPIKELPQNIQTALSNLKLVEIYVNIEDLQVEVELEFNLL